MKFLNILGIVNQIEKLSFLKILDGFCNEARKMAPLVDKILSDGDNQLKNIDDENLVKLFNLLSGKYRNNIRECIEYSDIHLDIVVDILVRDGKSIISREWFSKLYEQEITNLKSKVSLYQNELLNEKSELERTRKRDYLIYQNCVKTSYLNDEDINREKKVSWEEKTILKALSSSLELSREEVREIYYSVIPLKKNEIDDVISVLKECGIIFFKRNNLKIYVPDEIVWILREILNIEIPNKYLRRILRHLKDSEINLISKKHNIDRKLTLEEKIETILKQGVSLSNLLSTDIFKDDTPKTDRVKRIQELISNELELDLPKSGRSLEERILNIIEYYKNQEKEDVISLSKDGYRKLVSNLNEFNPKLNDIIKQNFELQDENVMCCDILSDYNITPRDIIYLMTNDELREFCKNFGISSRGHLVSNVLNKYRDVQDLFIENFELVGRRDINSLNERGLTVKESEFGILYENITKNIFTQLGLNVDEKLRGKLNTTRSKMDILINLGGKQVIIVECKTVKDNDYNKYTPISRQLISYKDLCDKGGYSVSQFIIISNDFSDEFVNESEYDMNLGVSLITSKGLLKILEGYKNSNLKEFPVRLLMKDGLLNEDRMVKVICGS